MKDINALYTEEDFARSIVPYHLYRKSLETVLDFNQVESFFDAGCINGKLMESIKRKYPHMKIKGFDYFEWAKQYADNLVKNEIIIGDLRKPLELPEQYDVVNCTEVGEHIDREYEGRLLENLTKACRHWLVLSWSKEENPQHLNPRSARYIRKQVEKLGFVMLPLQTTLFRRALKNNVNEHGHQWWSESVYIYQRKNAPIHRKFFIPGTRNREEGSLAAYTKGWLTIATLQESFMQLTHAIRGAVAGKQHLSITRFGDGDFFFLMRWAKGSAGVGKRGTTVPYSEIDSPLFRYWFMRNRQVSFELAPHYKKKYVFYFFAQLPFWNRLWIKEFLKRRRAAWQVLKNHWSILTAALFGPQVPFEALYALVATRWVFREYGNNIGLIGNEKKLQLIQKLLLHKEYRDYIGVESFVDFIPVPQKGAADKPYELAKSVGEQIAKSKAKVFLVGAGHAKTFLNSYLQLYTDAVIIDVGTGIDALAGCINQERPYFADWVNFRIKGENYDEIDQMDYNIHTWDKSQYKTVWLENNFKD